MTSVATLRRRRSALPAAPAAAYVGPATLRRRRGVPPSPTPPDLVAAVAARLRATSAVASLLAETGTRKALWFELAFGGPALPYLVMDRPDFTYTFMSGGNFVAKGEVVLNLHAASSAAVQTLSDTITKGQPGDPPGALDDPPLVWRGGRLMKFRLSRPAFDAATSPAPGSPSSYHRVLTFSCWYSGQIL